MRHFHLAAVAAFLLTCHIAVAQEPTACVQTATSCVALNADVTAETIDQTICVPGYLKERFPLAPGA